MTAPRTILTTDANSGIGLVTVIALAKAGFHSVGSVRSKTKAGHVAEAAKKAGVSTGAASLRANRSAGAQADAHDQEPSAWRCNCSGFTNVCWPNVNTSTVCVPLALAKRSLVARSTKLPVAPRIHVKVIAPLPSALSS